MNKEKRKNISAIYNDASRQKKHILAIIHKHGVRKDNHCA